MCSSDNPLFFLEPVYLSLSSEIISVERWVVRGRERSGEERRGEGGVASVTLPPPPPPAAAFSIMTGAQLTFLCTIWDQIALFQLAVSLHYVFNPVKQLYHVHGNPGFALHQLQQIYNGILDGEIRKWFFSDLPRARFIRATQGSLLCSNAAKNTAVRRDLTHSEYPVLII